MGCAGKIVVKNITELEAFIVSTFKTDQEKIDSFDLIVSEIEKRFFFVSSAWNVQCARISKQRTTFIIFEAH